ncbi:MAG: radical SAM protein [Candidatus Entotheonellia bacterium]
MASCTEAPDHPWVPNLNGLWLEITPKCNVRCVHCYADSAPWRPLTDTMQLADWCEILREASALGCRRVQFIGGEPTLHPELDRLIEYSRSLGFDFVEVFTNGTMFSGRLKEVFQRQDVHLAFSVYAARDAIHDAITQRQGSFRKTIATIQWALSHGLRARVAIIAMDINASDILATRRMLQHMGVTAVDIDRARGIGRGGQGSNSTCLLQELCGSCGQGSVCVSSDGQIYPCVFSRFWPVGHVKQGLASAVGSLQLQAFRQAVSQQHTGQKLS